MNQETKFIAQAYYHLSETTYAFGPFTERQLERFIADDPTPNKHDDWSVTLINHPKLYGTGMELNAY